MGWDKVNIQETGRQAVFALLSPADSREHGHTSPLPSGSAMPRCPSLGTLYVWGFRSGGGYGADWFHDTVTVELIHSFIQPFTYSIFIESLFSVCMLAVFYFLVLFIYFLYFFGCVRPYFWHAGSFVAARVLHCGVQASLWLGCAGFLSLVMVHRLQSVWALQFAARGLFR